MASISTDSGGRRRILFSTPDGQRRTLRLGTVSLRTAEAFRLRVEALAEALTLRLPVEPALAAWLADLPDSSHDRLARAQLVEPRTPGGGTLGALLDAVYNSAAVKPSTLRTMQQTRAALEAGFGADRRLAEVSPMAAASWRASMVEAGLAQATIAKRVKTARSIFAKAVKWGWLRGGNSFADVRAGTMSNSSRMHFVGLADAGALLDAAPDPSWRALIALSRYGGFRVPSEAAALRWGDVLWDRLRLMVRSPKTEGLDGRGVRPVPLFPELRAALQAAFDAAPAGEEFVIGPLRGHANLGVALGRLIARAGLQPWPKPWHAMRSSRQTELSETFPAATVAAWMGNTLAVAQAHYLQVRDAHFDAAASPGSGPERDAKSDARPAQNPAQPEPAPGRCEGP
jgi:integrase